MATVTGTALINAALRKADMRTGFIDTVDGGEAFDLLNETLDELWDLLYEAGAELYALSSGSFSTLSGQADYLLSTIAPSTFYRLVGVEQLISGKWVSCDRFNWGERNNFQSTTTGPFRYALVGGSLRLAPAPTSAHSMRIHWVPLPPSIATGAGTVDLQGPWKQFVTLGLAINFLAKEESDPSILLMQKEKAEARIRSAAKLRDSNRPVTITDVRGGDSTDPRALPWWGY